MSSAAASRRTTRSSGALSAAEVRALGLADDLILHKVYELFCPEPPPYTFDRVIPTAEPFLCAFQASHDEIQTKPIAFQEELTRM